MSAKNIERAILERLAGKLSGGTPALPPNLIDAARVLGVTLWSDLPDYTGPDKLSQIMDFVQNGPSRFTVVESGHGVGKTFDAAAVAAAWLERYKPAAKVVTLAPCYDDQTEISTDKGWRLFRDLDGSELVAQLRDGRLEYVKPVKYYDFPYSGEMIGYKSQLLDFLVTPNHRCWFSPSAKNEKPFEIREAQDIYQAYGRMQRIAEWRGQATPISLDYAEFLGFWFAEGWAEFNPIPRKYRVTLTGQNKVYIEDLLRRAGFNKWSVEEKTGGAGTLCWNYVIYDKALARIFAAYGKTFTKRVPQFIKDATPDVIRAFLDGFREGDGCVDANGSEKLITGNKLLADDLQELCLKAGWIANIATRRNTSGWGTGSISYVVSVWHKRGHYPLVRGSTTKAGRSGWYKVAYTGRVYCVEVPTGVVLVRRNGKFVWSGNTHVQVNAILWNYIRKFHASANLTPDIFETPNWKIGPECFAIGLSPRKASADDLQALHGYHSPNLLIIMDEAPGLPRLMWEAIRGLVTGENNRILALGNPLEQAGPFWEACVGGTWNYVNISCLDHPNVVLGRDAIPGAVSRAWVDEMVRDHCTPAAEGDAGAIEWAGQWWQPDSVFMSRVLGKAPTEASDQLISLAWVSDAQTWIAEPQGYEPIILGMDCSRVTHGDSSTIVARKGPLVLWVKRRKIQSANPGREMAGWLADEYRHTGASKAYVEETGVGTTVVDSARAIGVPVVAVSPGNGASSRNMANLRAEMWWRMREALQRRALSLPQDDMLAADLCAPKYYYDGGGRIILEPKDKIRGRLGRSPDSGDALATTFAHEGVEVRQMGDLVKQVRPVSSRWAVGERQRRGPEDEGRGSRWRV